MDNGFTKTLRFLGRTLLLTAAFLFCIGSRADVVRQEGIKVPADCYDVILPDSVPYVLFATQREGGLFPLRDSYLRVCSRQSGECKWSIRFHSSVNQLLPAKEGLFVGSGYLTTRYDYDSGKAVMKYKAMPAYIDGRNGILVGYKGDSFNKLIGFDISTGKELWKIKIGKNSGREWKLLATPDSATVIAVGDNIWRLNTLTGEIKEFAVQRRIHDKKTNFLTAALGVLTGVLTGFASYSPTYFSGIGSDVLPDSGRMYVADREAVSCIDNKLDTIWRYRLPEKSGSMSCLYLRGDTLDMLNTGIAFTGERRRKIGNPYFASFDKNSGRNIHILRLPKEWDRNIFGEQLDFVTDTVYVYDYQKEAIKPWVHHDGSFPVVGNNGKLMMVDADLKILKETSLTAVFFKVGEIGDDTILSRCNGDDRNPVFVRIDSNGKVTDNWTDTGTMFLNSGNRLYYIKDNTLHQMTD